MSDIESSLPGNEKLDFKRSFWIVFAAIALLQIYTFVLAIKYGFKLDLVNPEFYFYIHLGGVCWYLVFSGVLIFDLKFKDISIRKVANIHFSALKSQIKPLLIYFVGVGIFIVFLSLFEKTTQLKIQNQKPLSLWIILLSAVVFAPICEEFIFRGYLYTAMFNHFKRKRERMVVNAMLFAGAHVFLVEFLLGASVPYYIFVLGYLLAKLYEEQRSIMPCIVLHCLNNSLVFLMDWIKLSA